MKAQACVFNRKQKSETEHGIAILNSDFGCSDVKVIIDEQGKPVKSLWTYRLINYPIASAIDTDLGLSS